MHTPTCADAQTDESAALGAEKVLLAREKAMDKPDITVTEATASEEDDEGNGSDSRASSTISGGSFGFERQASQAPREEMKVDTNPDYDDEDEVEAPSTCSEELSSLEKAPGDEEEEEDASKNADDASSAFDSATYYV